MEYDFSLDEYQRPRAQFSMEAVAFGPWFCDECNTVEQVERVLSALARIEAGQQYQYEHTGLEQRLLIETGEVTVCALSLLQDSDIEPHDEMLNFYDEEQVSGCGLDDFKACMHAWRDYLSEHR